MLLLFPIMDCCTKKRLLTCMTSVCACTAFGLLSLAVATDYWLHTDEKVANATASMVYNHVHSGLWTRCMFRSKYSLVILVSCKHLRTSTSSGYQHTGSVNCTAQSIQTLSNSVSYRISISISGDGFRFWRFS